MVVSLESLVGLRVDGTGIEMEPSKCRPLGEDLCGVLCIDVIGGAVGFIN